MKSDPESQEYKDAAAALELAVLRNIEDLKSDPARYFLPKVGSKCTVLHLTPHYLGQTCFFIDASDPPELYDKVMLASQGPINESDGWLYGSPDNYFGDPFPHGARETARVGLDMTVRVIKE